MTQLLLSPKSITIPASSTAIILKHVIKSNEVSSGHFRIASKKKNNLKIKMAIIDEDYPQLSMFKDIPNITNQFRIIEANKSKERITKLFDCNQKIDVFEIGGKPYIKDVTKNYKFKGNYGLMYYIDLKLVNSQERLNEVKLFFAPKKDNAIDRAVVILNNNIKEIGLLTKKNGVISMENFYKTMLKPNETKEVSFLIFPQAGCYYPIDIIIKSDEKLL